MALYAKIRSHYTFAFKKKRGFENLLFQALRASANVPSLDGSGMCIVMIYR